MLIVQATPNDVISQTGWSVMTSLNGLGGQIWRTSIRSFIIGCGHLLLLQNTLH